MIFLFYKMKTYELSFQKNIRDIGGLKTADGHHIKYGRLFRGGALIHLNKEDIEIINSWRLTDIVDFRSEEEFLERSDYPFKDIKVHNIPVLKKEKSKKEMKGDDGNLLWFIDAGNSGFNHLQKTYGEFVTTKEGRSAFKKFFEIILQDNKVTYFHCSQGKDRTGFAAYLIEIALGVSNEAAIEDYLLSNVAMKKRTENLLKSVVDKPFFNESYRQSLYDVFSAKLEYLQDAIDKMNSLYGGTINFMKEALGVDIDKLKELYLEE